MQATIEAVPCDTVIIATPMNLSSVIQISKPTVVVSGARRITPFWSHFQLRFLHGTGAYCQAGLPSAWASVLARQLLHP